MDARNTDTLNYRAAELAEEIATATRKGWTVTQVGELAEIRQAVLDELHARAGREDVARSMHVDDLQDMLPDFEKVAELCGIRPERAAANRQIVVDELRRRGIEAR